MVLSKGIRYFILYCTISTGLLSWSLQDSLSKSYNHVMFLVEITDGLKLGILINFIFMAFALSTKLLQNVLFGELRVIEIEHLVEKIPMFSLNLLFNLAHNDNNFLLNCFLLGLSISFKVIQVVLVDRLDFNLVKVSNSSEEDHYSKRMVLRSIVFNLNFWLSFIFLILNFIVAKFLVFDVFQGINSVTCLLFGFQFAIQGVESLTYNSKLIFNVYELLYYRADQDYNDETDDENEEDERTWESKPYFSKGIDILSSSLKAIAHLGFMYLLTFHSGLSLPISMLQGTYTSLRQVYHEFSQLLAFIEASKRLESQLPNASKDDIDNSDSLCIICREDMCSAEEYEESHGKKISSRRCPKRLKCNHILHMGCLKDWLERSEICPMCRRKVFESESNQQTERHTAVNELQDEAIEIANDPDRRAEGEQNVDSEMSNLNVTENGQTAPTQTDGSTIADEFQTIRLPSSALIPPGWTLLPLHKEGNGEYKIDFSNYHQGTLTVRENISNRDLTLVKPSALDPYDDIMTNENDENESAKRNTTPNIAHIN
ncbi:uncharacterized protein PRCAT00002190001 [Priceomyces carsonii]|uniref:uncharacterized protein n=1 Tax=Priceomyces carsonii TaxID=28549 RepID=UPI002ED80A1A|nr:unnamed protein product [Priceomyces carsonii]